jgi:hypothetical protein
MHVLAALLTFYGTRSQHLVCSGLVSIHGDTLYVHVSCHEEKPFNVLGRRGGRKVHGFRHGIFAIEFFAMNRLYFF